MPTIDRKDLITEADLDEPEQDDMDTMANEVSLEDIDTLISFREDSKDSWE